MNGDARKNKMFGPHLTLDLYGCNPKKLNDIEFIFKFLDELPGKLGMTRVGGPSLILYHGGGKKSFDKGGVSGFVIIAESHVSIHTFVTQRFASVDIFSCKSFNISEAEKNIIQTFEAKKIEKHFLTRGREFPRDIKRAKAIVMSQRKKL